MIGCMIPRCNLQRGITQPIPRLFDISVQTKWRAEREGGPNSQLSYTLMMQEVRTPYKGASIYDVRLDLRAGGVKNPPNLWTITISILRTKGGRGQTISYFCGRHVWMPPELVLLGLFGRAHRSCQRGRKCGR